MVVMDAVCAVHRTATTYNELIHVETIVEQGISLCADGKHDCTARTLIGEALATKISSGPQPGRKQLTQMAGGYYIMMKQYSCIRSIRIWQFRYASTNRTDTVSTSDAYSR